MHNFLPVLALVFNAFVWGVSWWPFRQLHGAGVHPLWATALMYALAVGACCWRAPACSRAPAHPPCGCWRCRRADQCGLQLGRDGGRRGARGAAVLSDARLVGAAGLARAGRAPHAHGVLRLVMAFAGVVLVLVPAGMRPLSAWWATCRGRPAGPGRGLLLCADQRHPAPPAPRAQRIRMLAMFGGGALMATASACAGLLAGFVTRCPLWPWAGSWSRCCWPRPFY
jgi:hypothetical protein